MFNGVAEHLRTQVLSGALSPSESDPFARSSFNRYYYSAFLEVRPLILRAKPNIELRHKEIPKLLKGSIHDEVEKLLKRRHSTKFIDDRTYLRLSRTTKESIRLLAELFENAYEVRVIADYKTDIRVQFKNQTYSLGNTPIKDAVLWRQRVASYAQQIDGVLQEIGFEP